MTNARDLLCIGTLTSSLLIAASCRVAPADEQPDGPDADRAAESASADLAQLAGDDFNRADAPLSDDRKWTGNFAGTANFRIVANSLRATSTAVDNVMIYTGIATPNNQYARIDLKALHNSGTTSFPGVLLRWGSGSNLNGYDCRVAGPSASRLGKWVNGNFVKLTWQNGTTWRTGDSVQCEAEQTSIRMYRIRDGVKTLAAQTTDDTYPSGNTGLIIFSGRDVQDVLLDNLAIGSLRTQAVRTHLGCLMPLGDSITQTNSAHLGYRYRLWEKLQQNGVDLNFVGSMHANYSGSPSYPDPAFDRDHEGHWGWRADALLQKLPGWLASYTPGIVLIHVGTNDVDQGQSNESTIADIAGIIDALRQKNPHVAILLAQLIPTADAAARERIIDLNGRIPDLASAKTTADSPVRVVDQFSGFNAATDTFDGVHPNEQGERKMADRWYAALQPLIADGLTDCR